MNVRNRRFLLFTALISATLVLAVACGGGTSSSDKTATAGAGGGKSPAATTGGDKAPADQQKITVNLGAEPLYYDPHRSNFEQDIGIQRIMFRGLYNLEDDGKGGVKVVAAMADGDPQISGTTYTVKIKAGNKWSDGQPVTAKDFVFGLQQACDPVVASPYQYILGAGLLELKGCDESYTNEDTAKQAELAAAIGATAPDDSTLVLQLGRVVPNFKTLMSLWVTFPGRSDVVAKFGDKWIEPANIVVNGPYTLKEVVPKDHATLVPNPNWTGQKPTIQELTVRFIDDLTVAYRGFQTGEIQSTQIAPTDVKTAEGDSSLKSQLLVSPSARITAVEIQMKDPALSKFEVRLALSRAVDRKTLNDVVFDGVYTPATYWVAKGVVGFQGGDSFDNVIGFDKAAAQKALSDAGYPNGQGFPDMKILLTDTATNRNLADFLIKAWKDNLNVTVTPEFVDGKTRSARFNSKEFQLLPGGWQSDYPDTENFLIGLFDTGGGNNMYECSDPEIDAAFQAASSATDDATRIKNYQQVEKLVVTKLCGAAPIYQNARPWLISSKLGGVTPNGVLDAGTAVNWCGLCCFFNISRGAPGVRGN